MPWSSDLLGQHWFGCCRGCCYVQLARRHNAACHRTHRRHRNHLVAPNIKVKVEAKRNEENYLARARSVFDCLLVTIGYSDYQPNCSERHANPDRHANDGSNIAADRDQYGRADRDADHCSADGHPADRDQFTRADNQHELASRPVHLDSQPDRNFQ